jgi:hypothetical protein
MVLSAAVNLVNIELKRDAPGKNRTCDPLLRRQVLYPLSYRRSENPHIVDSK